MSVVADHGEQKKMWTLSPKSYHRMGDTEKQTDIILIYYANDRVRLYLKRS